MNRKDEYTRCVVPEVEISEGWRGVNKLNRTRESHTDVKDTKRPRREVGPSRATPNSVPNSTTQTPHPKETLKHPRDKPELNPEGD